MEQNKKKWSLIALAFGFIFVFLLINIYNNVNILNVKEASFCHINDLIDCDGVSQTKYAQFLGIPLCLWGLLFYLFILFMVLIDDIKTIPQLGFLKVFKNPSSYIYSLSFVSVVVSVTLAIIQIVDIQKICYLCWLTYFVDFVLLLVNKTWGKGLFYDIKVSIDDFIEAIKVKRYAVAFFSIMLLGIAVLVYTTTSMVLAPQVKSQIAFDKLKELKSSDFPVYGNDLGDKDAKVVAIQFSDFQCPYCSMYNTVLYKVMKSGKISGVKLLHKNFPLDQTCNKYLTSTMHKQACMLAKYAIAAEKQGKHWDLVTILFDEKPTTETQIKEMAINLDIDVEQLQKDAHSAEVRKQLEEEIDEAVRSGISGTPALVINGKPYNGMKLDYQLEEILIENGAKRN